MAAAKKQITESQLLADIKAQQFAPVYLITGEENYFIDTVSDFFEQFVVPEEFRDFDQTVLYGYDSDMRQVLSAAGHFPMMAPYQLVLVKEAQGISKDWDLVEAYLQNPPERTVLVFCYRHKKFDKRTKAYKAIADKGLVYERAKLYESQLPTWIAERVNEAGYSITQKGAMLIAECIGNDLQKVMGELTKVFISLHPGDVINEDVIERNIGISKEYNVFELQTAIGRRDVVRCNRIVNHFAANPKDNPIQMVLPSIYNYLVKVMIYLQLPDKAEAASALKVNPYFVGDYATAASNYTLGKLATCIGYISEADLRSKGIRNSGTVTDGELLKELIFKIIH
ncbi:MAG: DNA polymerase III subunit delta [Bacteroidales bacterium]|nr:DNA polymerase III subunit delta [Bacteroidales bacterium]